MDSHKSMMFCTHHYSLIQNSFTPLKSSVLQVFIPSLVPLEHLPTTNLFILSLIVLPLQYMI